MPGAKDFRFKPIQIKKSKLFGGRIDACISGDERPPSYYITWINGKRGWYTEDQLDHSYSRSKK